MAELKFGKLSLVPGVRVESTDGVYSAKTVGLSSSGAPVITPVSQSRSYTDVFPGLNARYDVNEDLVLRGAVTTAIGRPDYNNLPPYVVVDTTGTPATVSMGNPALKPLKARNFDLSAEYYLPGQGVISLAAFYKDIDDPIYTAQATGQNGTFGGIALTGATVSSFANATSAEIKGVEINLQEQFGFLPSPLDGLGASANIAVIDSSASGIPSRTDTLPLFNQSKYVGTAQIFYEKYGFTARLAYSYRSKYLLTVGTNTASDVYVAQMGQLDARIGYDLSEKISIYLEAANVNSAPYRTFIGTSSHLYENERYSASSKLGIQVKL
jgi:TonB-dependent receptor